MELRQASSCLSIMIWMCSTSVISVKNLSSGNSTNGFVPDRPAPTTLGIKSNITSPTSPVSGTRQKSPFKTDVNQQKTPSPQNSAEGNITLRIGKVHTREPASKRNTDAERHDSHNIASAIRGSSSSATAEQLRSATSLAGTLVLLLISVVIAGALFIMVICFIHKWKENMGTGQYPRVVYSMLRQSEDEPEDVLGEILINIGLATPGDTRPLTPPSSSSSSSSGGCSPTPAEPEMDLNDLEGTKFTTIPLRSEEASKRLTVPDPEESDEELLQ